MRRRGRDALLLIGALATPPFGYGQSSPPIPDVDRVRLAEAFRLADRIRPRVWPGWERTPLVVLLVADSMEYLIGHPNPTSEFISLGRDPLLRRQVLARPRRFPPTLLATFPAVGGRATIVIGTAERTGKPSAEWVLTLLHEHFHQWQSSLPDYYARADALGLARGDTTGQWMLNYPFPYDSVPVQRQVKAWAAGLGAALVTPDDGRVARLARERAGLRRVLSPEDDRYLEFQLWQEGVPRYVELAAARAAARSGEPPGAFRRLPDYVPYAELAARLRHDLERQLAELSLGRERRIAFYRLGAGLALLLEQGDEDWQLAYRRHPFSMPPLLP
ncbi:MAG TPA: hypothetical protein VH764_01840 [Gemmatimonadales bacterium]|jgi:hypothetical protein